MSDLVFIIVLILFNGLLALSEISLISVRKSYLANEVKSGSKLAKIALKLANEPDNFLSTVQIGITIIGILTGIYSGSVLSTDFSIYLMKLGVSTTYALHLSQIIIVVSVTYLTLIFGELVPKRIGMSIAEKSAKIVARPMYILSVVASPFVWILSKSTSFIMNLLCLDVKESRITEEEIKSLIQESTENGDMQEVEQNIVERVFMLGDLKVSSLMTHRTETVSLDINMTNEQIVAVLKNRLFGLYPVLDRNLDTVIGVVTLKNLMFKITQPEFNLREAVQPATFFPENISVYNALEKMKEQGISHSLVCDEFGSFQGMLTLKDILEGLVGSMNDAQKEPDIVRRSDNESWLIDGQCPFYDFLSYFKKEYLYTENSYNTLGGLIIELMGRIPKTGESTTWENITFEIMDMDGARIDKILVTLGTIKK